MSEKKAALLSKDDAKKVMKLACLTVSDAELETVTGNLNSIIGYVGRLDEVNVDSVEPMSHVHGSKNIFRADELQPSLPVQDLLAIAPTTSGRFIKVPIVVDEG